MKFYDPPEKNVNWCR